MKDVDFWLDEYVNRYRLSPRYFKDIFRHIKDNIKKERKKRMLMLISRSYLKSLKTY